MARAPSALLALIVVAAAAGCPPAHTPVDAGPGEGEGEGEGEGAAGVDPTTYCESIVDFFCPFYLRCGRMAVADADACRPVFLEACNARFEPTFVSLAGAGLLTLSQDGIDACRTHLADVSCADQIEDLDGSCATMWQGTQAAGEACGFDVETFTCAPGTRCDVDLTLCGTCHTVVADGADCSDASVTCGATSDCDSTSFLCVARKKVGEACSAADRCVLGALCNGGVCTAPAYAGLGDACDFDNRCPYASACVNGTCAATVELGGSCDTVTPCDSGYCSDSSNGTCTALVAQGEACDVSEQCQTGVCANNGDCSVVPSACFNP